MLLFKRLSFYFCVPGCVHMSAGVDGSQRHQIPVAAVRGGWEPPDMGVGSLYEWYMSLTTELSLAPVYIYV